MEYSRRPTKSIPKENQLKILNKIYQTYLVSTTDGICVLYYMKATAVSWRFNTDLGFPGNDS